MSSCRLDAERANAQMAADTVVDKTPNQTAAVAAAAAAVAADPCVVVSGSYHLLVPVHEAHRDLRPSTAQVHCLRACSNRIAIYGDFHSHPCFPDSKIAKQLQPHEHR